MSRQNGKKRKSVNSRAETVGTWKCYRCNLIFHDESLALLHEDISSHSAVRIEFDYGGPRLTKESLGLMIRHFTN